MYKFLKNIAFIALFLVLSAEIFAQNSYSKVEDVPNPKTLNVDNFVANPDEILNFLTENEINNILQNLETETSAEVALVLLKSIETNEIDDFSVRLFERWGVGKKGEDNGLLILFVEDQRKIRFEVGYGLEGILPDAICKRIQTQKMLPCFKENDYNNGILAGVQSIADIIKNEGKISDNSLIDNEKTNYLGWLIFYGAMSLILLIFIIYDAKNIKNNLKFTTNRDRFYAMKSEKNAIISVFSILVLIAIIIELFLLYKETIKLPFFFLTCATLFVQIPAVIYANKKAIKFRKQTIFCTVCKQKMILLDEQKDDGYLSKKQCFEECIKSVDYDVFVCENCQHNEIYAYDNLIFYKKCPKCDTKAFSSMKKEIVVQPTTLHAGRENETFYCKFCKYKEVKTKKLPRLSSSAGVVGGGVIGGGFSGGGSFGGGSSGGGGATSRW
ncbi:MAG: TPM domain-containing protein [Prevotellaceae bacterium]|nr:TPM domain-containing protein [Prevotellaceae bacterium]